MAMVTIGSNGRVTLPVAVRRRLGVRAGSRVIFAEVGPDRYEVVASLPVTALKGIVSKPRRRVTVAEMNATAHRRRASGRLDT